MTTVITIAIYVGCCWLFAACIIAMKPEIINVPDDVEDSYERKVFFLLEAGSHVISFPVLFPLLLLAMLYGWITRKI